MSGQYILQEEAEAGPVKVYLENHQLFIQKPNQLPVELYPTGSEAVFHHYFNGMDLTLTFQRNQLGQASGAQGSFSFKPYDIDLPYHLTRVGGISNYFSLPITLTAVGIALLALGVVVFVLRRRMSVVRVS